MERCGFNERMINKTMRRTRVDKSNSRKRCRIRDVEWNKRNREMKRVYIGKSRCIESILLGQHTELNAILSICRVLRIAFYFFEFAVEPKFLERVTGAEIIVADHPLAAKDEDLVQSLAMCPAAPQNIHSLLFKHYFHSARSNLPSLPRTESAVVVGIELEDFQELLLLDLEANVNRVGLAEVEVLNVASADLPLL